ncbi:Glycoside hydrolase, family 5 [Dillenia turbinata]|uniref:Glycoside hydrolase, family 5 n=1 Tax=Dillenia turbinata TaxID=194707 RepID=A0AAN8Z355_9MAGN
MGGALWVVNILALYFAVCSQDFSLALPYKAASLGNWLVTEGWMNLSRFDGIPNNDLLDGAKVQIMSIKLQKYLSADNSGGSDIVANCDSASDWETFRLWRINESTFNLRVFNKQFMGLENQGEGTKVVAVAKSPGNSETFQIVRKENDRTRIRLKAPNGQFLQVNCDTLVTADYGGSGWEDDNPSIFRMTIDIPLRGEYQITNGYGPDKAPQVMQDHWNTYVTERDFSFMSKNGLDAVRIPVGWWIAHDPTPPTPFVGGSSNALDNAFTWAQKHGMKVIIDLHGVQGSQNGNDHSGARDGYQEWGDSYIPDTVAVIEFLARRYANNPALAAIELINEPMAPGVSLDTLKRYYTLGYNAVRKYTSDAYVILSNRLGKADPKELLSFASSLNHVVIDVHYYNLFWDHFDNMTVQQNINFVYNDRASQLRTITTSSALSFVGEWTAEWKVRGASKQAYQRFAKAQLEVYGNATFGWAYWAYKCALNHWSLQWMIENGYINLLAS